MLSKMSYWTYENHIHKYVSIHDATCSFCGNGQGVHSAGKTKTGNWVGPFSNLDAARQAAVATKRIDIRSCNLCLGQRHGVVQKQEQQSLAAPSVVSDSLDWDAGNDLSCSLSLKWNVKGRLALDNNGSIKFPSVSPIAGLYRFKTRYPDGRRAIYIGESTNLQRRFANYRTPNLSQTTNIRINSWLLELMTNGGDVSIAITDKAKMNGTDVDLSSKSIRRMFEQMAITLEAGEQLDSKNL